MMSEYLDNIHNAARDIRQVADEMKDIALCFAKTGNQEMYNTIIDWSQYIHDSQQQILQAVNKNINDSLQHQQKFTGETIGTMLEAIMDPISPK